MLIKTQSAAVKIDKKPFTIAEDWVVVILGFAIIGLALSGYNSPIPAYGWTNAEALSNKLFSAANLVKISLQFLLVAIIALLGVLLSGKPVKYFLVVFPLVYLLSITALIVAGNSFIKSLNLEAVIFSLAAGLLIRNFFSLPDWLVKALSTELFVKIGLVLLGTSIIFSDILKAGTYGLLQALIVVLSVWYFAFWLCKKMKVDSELTMMIASAVSICGVSAAIATSGAIQGDSKKLSLVISLVLICAVPMMIVMPYLANWMALSEQVTGAWLGGSIDTTGAVVAAGTLVGDEALKISTIVKFSQNVLLGLAAFAISIYWTWTKKTPGNKVEKPTAALIWQRFPKFVLGFIAASLVFSFMLSAENVNLVKDGLKNLQTLWFVMAFTSIGLETNFSDLFKNTNRKAIHVFFIAQGFNILVTLLIAYILFG